MLDVKSKFTLHPQYKNFAPGQSEIDIQTLSPHMASMNTCFMLLGITVFMLLMSLCPASMVLSALITDQSYAREGQRAIAVIRACEFEGKMSRATYTYKVGETSYIHDEFVDNTLCNDPGVGAALPILYLASDPATARLIHNHHFSTSLAMVIGFICILVLPFQGIRGMRHYLYARYTRRALARAHHLLEGEITAINGYKPYKHDAHYVRVWYQFETPRKRVLKGYAEAHRQDLNGKDLPPVGTPVTVLYADNGSHMML